MAKDKGNKKKPKDKKKKSKARALTGLAAALVKSGHLNEKAARKTAREQRKVAKELGREGVAELEAKKRAEAEARKRREAEAARARQKAKEAADARQRIVRAVRGGLAPPPRGGNRQWFFQTRAGQLPFLEVSDDIARGLRSGIVGIVESCGAHPDAHVVVEQRAVVTLLGIDKELVRFWNRPSESERK